MIDLIYNTLLTIINKEQQGYVSPTEFNILANQVQMEIFREYFEDENRDKNRENRGLINNGYSNLSFNQRQRIQEFAAIATIPQTSSQFTLPSDLYFIEEHGVVATAPSTSNMSVISEVERNQIAYLNRSSARPTDIYPVYERYPASLRVSPTTITEIEVRYVRTPSTPNWTYVVLPSGDAMYNPADAAFQDFELHESEFSNIVLRMLSYFGLNLREAEVIQIAETLKDKMNLKDNG